VWMVLSLISAATLAAPVHDRTVTRKIFVFEPPIRTKVFKPSANSTALEAGTSGIPGGFQETDSDLGRACASTP
jgi:hypothetical protein